MVKYIGELATSFNRETNNDLAELKNLRILFWLMAILGLGDYIMPQYFGIHVGFDFTTTRILSVLIIIYMMLNAKLMTSFINMILSLPVFIFLIPYYFVILYTTVLCVDINVFFMTSLELLTMFLVAYGIRYCIGVKRFLKWSVFVGYFLGIYGLVEYVCGQSLFLKFLATVPTTVINCYRSGQYRIMGPCGHALGYGLFLIILIAIATIDYEKDEIYLFKRPILIVLLVFNVMLTGSRSTLGVVGLEILLIVLLSSAENKKKTLLVTIVMIFALGIFELLFYNTSLGRYIMLQITSVVDQIFGTTISVNYGAELTRLNDSEEYRKVLTKIFQLDWLNPLVGRGIKRGFGAEIDGWFVESIDNFYIAQYIRYAYPGMITYIFFIIATLFSMIKRAFSHKSGICTAIAIGTLCYYINLYWLDTLQTLKYEYILIAIFIAYCLEKDKIKSMENINGERIKT